MTLFCGVIPVTGISFLMFTILLVAAVGYVIGSISVKGISLGTAGVFVAALLYGAFFYNKLGGTLGSAADALKVVENMGLVFFVTAVGFIAGPNFFNNLKKNFKSYILLGVIIILSSALACVLCFFVGKGAEADTTTFIAMLELLKSGRIRLVQQELYGPILLYKGGMDSAA